MTDAIFLEFVRWAVLPILLAGLGICTHNIIKNMRLWRKNGDTPLFFWSDWIAWYTMLLCVVAWILLWVF